MNDPASHIDKLEADVREDTALLADWAEEATSMSSVDADNCRERILAALSELAGIARDGQRATHRCVFPSCVDGEKPALCGQCYDAERAEAAEAERDRYRQALEDIASEVGPRPGGAGRRFWNIARAALSSPTEGVHAPTERPSGPSRWSDPYRKGEFASGPAETQEANQ